MRNKKNSFLKKIYFKLRDLLKSSNSFDKNNLLENFYQTLIYKGYKPVCVYDIGANKGTWTEETMKFFPNSQFVLFEPQLNLCNEIKEKFIKNKNINIFQLGVGNHDGELTFTMHERDDSCSFNISEEDALRYGYKQIITPIVRLDSFIIKNNLIPPDILKIDAEGFDIEVLEGAEQIIKEHVQIILIEVAIMQNKYRNDVNTVLNYMDAIGFKLFDITDLNRPFKNNVLWLCEFVFIKKNGDLDVDYLDI